MDNRSVCAVCRNTGHHGAQWVARIGNDEMRVHKPCGQKLVETAPEGTEVKLYPSKELLRKFADERRARDVQAFWKQKFATARHG